MSQCLHDNVTCHQIINGKRKKNTIKSKWVKKTKTLVLYFVTINYFSALSYTSLGIWEHKDPSHSRLSKAELGPSVIHISGMEHPNSMCYEYYWAWQQHLLLLVKPTGLQQCLCGTLYKGSFTSPSFYWNNFILFHLSLYLTAWLPSLITKHTCISVYPTALGSSTTSFVQNIYTRLWPLIILWLYQKRQPWLKRSSVNREKVISCLSKTNNGHVSWGDTVCEWW